MRAVALPAPVAGFPISDPSFPHLRAIALVLVDYALRIERDSECAAELHAMRAALQRARLALYALWSRARGAMALPENLNPEALATLLLELAPPTELLLGKSAAAAPVDCPQPGGHGTGAAAPTLARRFEVPAKGPQNLAESEGFEPPNAFASPDFESGRHSPQGSTVRAAKSAPEAARPPVGASNDSIRDAAPAQQATANKPVWLKCSKCGFRVPAGNVFAAGGRHYRRYGKRLEVARTCGTWLAGGAL